MSATFEQVLVARRRFLAGSLGSAAVAALPGCATQGTRPLIGFTPVAPSNEDVLRVPPEYEARVLYRWGDPVGSSAGMPRVPHGRVEQRRRPGAAGRHAPRRHALFPAAGLAPRPARHEPRVSGRGAAVPRRQSTWSAEKVLKAQNSVGVSVIEVRAGTRRMAGCPAIALCRRITARTPCRVAGPAAGHPLLRTAADPDGRRVLGTYNGCAHGWTPWGTYLTCEENFHNQFVGGASISPDQRRYRMSAKGLRLSLGAARRALRRGPSSQRVQPLRLGGGDRSL